MAQSVPVKSGVREIFERAQERGIPTAVATSSRAPHALGASRRRRACSTCSRPSSPATTSTNPSRTPSPTLRRRGGSGLLRDSALHIEDSHSGVQAAHGAGMQTIMVPDLVRPSADIQALCTA